MNMYDDLADSGYLNAEELRQQYQMAAAASLNRRDYRDLEKSIEGTQKFVDFNQYEIENSQAVLENIQIDPRFQYNQRTPHVQNQRNELSKGGQPDYQNPNFKKVFNPNLRVNPSQPNLQTNLPFDDHQMPSAIKSPLSGGQGNQSHLEIQQNLFGRIDQGNDLGITETDDDFLKDSTTGLPYNQPNQQNLRANAPQRGLPEKGKNNLPTNYDEDDDQVLLTQMATMEGGRQGRLREEELETLKYQFETQNQQQQTGRFPTQQVQGLTSNRDTEAKQPSIMSKYLQEDINRFKNNNDQIQQLLMQLQNPSQATGDLFGLNSLAQNSEIHQARPSHLPNITAYAPDTVHQIKHAQSSNNIGESQFMNRDSEGLTHNYQRSMSQNMIGEHNFASNPAHHHQKQTSAFDYPQRTTSEFHNQQQLPPKERQNYDLIKDNSILEMAKLKHNSGNSASAESGVTPSSNSNQYFGGYGDNQDILSGGDGVEEANDFNMNPRGRALTQNELQGRAEYSNQYSNYKDKAGASSPYKHLFNGGGPQSQMSQQQINLEFFKMPSVGPGQTTGLPTIANSIISFDKYTPNYPALRNAVPGQSYVLDDKLQQVIGQMPPVEGYNFEKENFDFNQSQTKQNAYPIAQQQQQSSYPYPTMTNQMQQYPYQQKSANSGADFPIIQTDQSLIIDQTPNGKQGYPPSYKLPHPQQQYSSQFDLANHNSTYIQNQRQMPPHSQQQPRNSLLHQQQQQLSGNFEVNSSVYHPPQSQQMGRQMSMQEAKRKEIMSKFDDIPIKDLNKAEAYQEKRMTDDTYDNNTNQGELAATDMDEASLSLIQRVEHSKWKIRMAAYKEISSLFYNEYSKECLRAKGQLQPEENSTEPEYDEHGNLLNKPFELYGPILHKIISDSNLIAQFEGLNCLFAFIKFSGDIKSVVHSVSTILLEKIQHNKPNFKEVTLKIIVNIFKRDKSLSFLPELLKRFKNKNFKLAIFSEEATLNCMRQQPPQLTDEVSLRSIFKAVQDNLSNTNKELREVTTQLVEEIYRCCEDDVATFIKNLKGLRPIQLKDIKEQFAEVQKHSKNLVVLFKNQQLPAAATPHTYNEGSPKRGKSALMSGRDGEGNSAYYTVDQDSSAAQNIATFGGALQAIESDLTLLVPENFFEIPYVTQINVKKKGVEALNSELEKLVAKKQQRVQVQVVNKDYAQIFNVITHMLEDSNALVFMEAIKTVEYLSVLMAKSIKQQKLKQFVALLTDKYKETKTAPIAAVNKALNTIIKSKAIPIQGLFDYMLNTLAANSKNARVKQLIIEKCDTTIQEESFLREDENALTTIFKHSKEKLIALIQKDTNANVRDAAVALLSTFKAYISSQQTDAQIVNDAISSLPHYRVTEINKLAQERPHLNNQTQVTAANAEQSSDLSQGRQPSLQDPKSQRSQSATTAHETESRPQAKQISQSSQDFFYSGKNISGPYQIHLAEIILSLKNLASPQPKAFSLTQLNEKWDNSLENLGEEGLKETKHIIVSCVHWLFLGHHHKLSSNLQLIELILNGLVKKIYCIERSIELANDQLGFISQELLEAVEVTLMSLKWVGQQRLLENILNVLMSAVPNGTSAVLRGVRYSQIFVQSFSHAFDFFASYQGVEDLSESERSKKEKEFVHIVIFSISYLRSKLDLLLSKNLQIQDLEVFREKILSSYLENLVDGQLRDALIRVMIDFKFELDRCAQEYGMNQSSTQIDEREQVQLKKLEQLKKKKSQNRLQSQEREEEQSETQKIQEEPKTIGQVFVETIDSDFQAGLQMIKGFGQNPAALDFANKDVIFQKVLSKVATHTKNPTQKQQQAFSMKALLWMKEEIFGVEDCFQFTPTVMICYARAEIESRDSSVELYLLNNWVKPLRLKDLIDRVSFVILNSLSGQSSQEQQSFFKVLFGWLMNHSLNGNQTEQWSLDDFRKISLLLSKNLFDDQVTEFFEMCVSKFGAQKVHDFMEIQLMHSQHDYNQFEGWFQFKFQGQLTSQSSKPAHQTEPKLTLPEINSGMRPQTQQRQQDQSRFEEPSQIKEALWTNPSNLGEMIGGNSKVGLDESSVMHSNRSKANLSHHSKLYQEMREKRKSSQHRRHQEGQDAHNTSQDLGADQSLLQAKGAQQQNDSLSKYDQIINRLEAQLQQEKQNWNAQGSAAKRRTPGGTSNVYGMPTDEINEQDSLEKVFKKHQIKQGVDEKEPVSKMRKYQEVEEEEESKVQLRKPQAIDKATTQAGTEPTNFQFYKSNTSNYYNQSEKASRYQIVKTDEEEQDEELYDSLANAPQIDNNNNKLKSNQQMQDGQDRLQESQIKEDLWKREMEKLQQEKHRLEEERLNLMRAKDKESKQWQTRFEQVRSEHEDVVSSLQEANKCYLTQVSENEELKGQLKAMQEQHKAMMRKFEQFEEKLNQQQEQQILERYNKQREQDVTIVRQEQLALVEKVFKDYQVQVQRGEEEVGTKKIQELLLNFSDRDETQRIGVSLYVHYQSLKSKDAKFKLLKGLSLALESEDVLFALPLETYKTVLDFNLKVFSNEKALIEKNSIRQSSQSMSRGGQANEQNEITVEAQKLVSKLLNSKEFTTSLVTLFQVLRFAMPEDLSTDLSEEQKHYLRVIMRCISRITKALHSENPDLIRAFDVLIEMQKIFLKNPPESLREDLPCLQEFDYVYRCLKDVSDKLMELQPHKVVTFLEFISNQAPNAFIKYMNSVMAPMMKKQEERSRADQYEDTYEGEEEGGFEDEELRYHNSSHINY